MGAEGGQKMLKGWWMGRRCTGPREAQGWDSCRPPDLPSFESHADSPALLLWLLRGNVTAPP